MEWRSTRSTRPKLGTRAWIIAVAMIAPALAWAHERWVPHEPRFPINHAFFQSMTGEVLIYSIAAGVAVFSVILLWYLTAPHIVEALAPAAATGSGAAPRGSAFGRGLRTLVRFALDGDVQSGFMQHGLTAATFFFSRIPAFVLGLGAYEGWLVMPSFPLEGPLALPLRITSAVLAVWVLTGLFWRVLGVVMLLVFVYLGFAYGIAAIDAIPVLASAFFYLFSSKDRRLGVNSRQLMGVRLSLGVGFFLLGLINKIYLADIFIGVGDQHPEIVAGPQAIFPALTREAWSYTTALGEMVFGLLLLVGIFNRITTAVLTYVFANFVFVFGMAEVVHVYPIAGFVLLFFRGPLGTSLDGLVFRANVRVWRLFKHRRSSLIYGAAVAVIAMGAASIFMFAPLLLVTEVVPHLTGVAVPPGYRPPPPAPPASAWGDPRGGGIAAPHSDHRPRHGGVVTMTGDDHVEIVVRKDGTILLYVTDAVRQPVAPRETPGSVRIVRPGLTRTVTLEPDTSGALLGKGPPPTAPAEYTYALTLRGKSASQTLAVPAGGTDGVVKRTLAP